MSAYTAVSRDAEGRRLCRWCDKPVPPPKLTFCGEACVHEWKLRTQTQYLRFFIEDRDHGVCAICAVDTWKIKDHLRELAQPYSYWQWNSKSKKWPAEFNAVFEYGSRYNLSDMQTLRILNRQYPYDLDHTVPLIEGGSSSPENVRTLCLACHSRETAALARRRAKKS